jgi:hypothetical protein
MLINVFADQPIYQLKGVPGQGLVDTPKSHVQSSWQLGQYSRLIE